MKDFKEWLSDNLRYFIIGIAVILVIAAAIIGIRVYSTAVNPDGEKNVTLIESEKRTGETQSETAKETDKKETEKETAKETENKADAKAKEASGTEAAETTAAETEAPQTEAPQTEAPQTEAPQTEAPQTEAPQTEPPEPVYMTLNHTCYLRSYADYGDNILGEYYAGTTVEFLADVGGWYEVSVDGMVGYMGARFLN